MLLKILLPNGKLELFKGNWEREESPLGWRVLVRQKGQGITGIVIGFSKGESEKEVISFPDKAPLVKEPQLRTVEEISRYCEIPQGKLIFSLIPAVFLWKEEKWIKPAFKKLEALEPKSRELLEYVLKRKRVKPESLMKRFKPDLVKLMIRKGFLREEQLWKVPEVKVIYYKLNIPLKEALKRVKSQTKKKLILLLSADRWVSEEEILLWGIKKSVIRDMLKKGILKASEEIPQAEQKLNSETFLKRIPMNRTLLWGDFERTAKEIQNLCLKNLEKEGFILIVASELEDLKKLKELLKPSLGGVLYEIHSRISPRTVFESWFSLQEKAGVLLGTFTSILCPVKNLKSLILLNESSPAVKLKSAGEIDLRRLCFVLSEKTGASVVFATPAPSVASYYLRNKGKMKTLKLKTPLPNVKVFEKKTYRILTDELIREIKRNIFKKILFLIPKEGYSHAICPRCEDLVQCSLCGAFMGYSHKIGVLFCPLCSHKREDLSCPICGGELEEIGMGIEKIVSEVEEYIGLRKNFYFSTYVRWSESYDITVVVTADNLLSFPTYRAKEDTFLYLLKALISAKEKLFIQTLYPQELMFKCLASQKIGDFYTAELEERRKRKLPPFFRLVLVKSSREDLVAYIRKTVSPYVRVNYSLQENCYRFLISFKDTFTLRKLKNLSKKFPRDIIEIKVDPF